MGELVKKILRGQMTIAVIYIVLGLCLTFTPVGMVNLICKFVFGILLIAAGLYHVGIYVLERMNATPLDLFSGTIILVLGVFLFWNPQIVIRLLPMLLGAFVLIDSIWSLKGCLRLKKHGSGAWKILLGGSLIFIVLGIVLIANPFTIVKNVVIFAGITLLVNGAADIVFMVLLRRGIKEIVDEIEEEQGGEFCQENAAQDEELQEPLSEETQEEQAQEPAETYEPWNGATAAANRPAKKSFWEKLKKKKTVEEETEPAEEEPVLEANVAEETGAEEPVEEEDVSEAAVLEEAVSEEAAAEPEDILVAP